MIVCRQATALFNIQKNNGTRRKALFLRSGRGSYRVCGSRGCGLRVRFQLFALRPVVEQEKTEFLREQKIALAQPIVLPGLGWSAEPIPGEVEGLAKDRKCGITRIVIKIEAQKDLCALGRLLRGDQLRKVRYSRGHRGNHCQ